MLTEEERVERKKLCTKQWRERNKDHYNEYMREWQRKRRAELKELQAYKKAATENSPSADPEEEEDILL